MDRARLNEILEKHKKWLNFENDGVRADLSHSDLSQSDLSYSDMSHSNMRHSDMSHSDMSRSNLLGSNLRGSNLSHSNIDYSCWPLWCGSLDVHIDVRIARQLLYHLMRPCLVSPDVSEDFKRALFTPELIAEANKFHRVEDCGQIYSPFEDEEENHGQSN